MNRFNVRQLTLVFLLFLFVGCASLNTDNMVIENTSIGVRHPVAVAVNTKGGSPHVQWYSGTISPEEFMEAVIKSIEKSALFKEIVGEDTADYVLSAVLTYAGSHPGAAMTAWVNTNWSLVDRVSGDNVWNAEIYTEGHAGAFEAFNGMTRQYMALERGARENIDQALTQIRELNLGSK